MTTDEGSWRRKTSHQPRGDRMYDPISFTANSAAPRCWMCNGSRCMQVFPMCPGEKNVAYWYDKLSRGPSHIAISARVGREDDGLDQANPRIG